MCFLFRYHCAPFCFRYYWSNTDKWQSSSGTGKSVPIRQSFVAFTVAIKSMQMSSNVTKCHIFFIRCELEGHAVSPDTGLDIEIVETIDYQDFFEVFFSNCPNAPMSSLIPSSLMGHISNATLFRKITITQRLTMILICWLPRCPLASDPSCRSRTWSAPAGPWTGSFNQFLTPLSEWQRMSGWWITKSVEVFFGGQVIIPARFGSEVIFYWRNPSTDSLLRIVTSRDNWWDNTFYKISCNADSRNILMDINS